MKIKNLCQNYSANLCAQMALDLHDIKIETVDNESADILIFDAYTNHDQVKDYPAAIKLCFDLQHADVDKHRGWSNVGWLSYNDPNTYVIIECEDPGFSHNKILYYDFLWNRSKAYYLNRNWNITNLWYYNGSESFYLQPVSSAEQKTRLFLSPNKLCRPNTAYRSRLTDLVSRYDVFNLGYSSALTTDATSTDTLYPNRRDGMVQTVDELDQRWPSKHLASGYDPVHNAYYNETFFSVYAETIEFGTTQFITEKTLEPLIKGHFILPFSSAGFVEYVQSQGWKLPSFIDYSYDSISDNELRFRTFRQEFLRLCSLSLEDWRQLWIDNIEIINYNRNQLINRPYHRLELLDEMQNMSSGHRT